MKKLIWLPIVLFILTLTTAGTIRADMITKESMVSGSKKRYYYLFVPKKLDKSTPAPLIVVLHGSGDSGLMPVKRWRDLAETEGILIAGPNSLDPQAWRIPADAPEFIYEMVESLKKKHSIDPQRVYLFGHSGGAIVALYLALLQSEYFAAASVHAGAMRPEDGPFIERTRRKIPISLFVGTMDPLFPVKDLRETRDMLTSRGFSVELTEIKGHNHDYRNRAAEINLMIWDFFKKHRLEGGPIHQVYNWDKVNPVVEELREEGGKE